jgi:hypothetical protein
VSCLCCRWELRLTATTTGWLLLVAAAMLLRLAAATGSPRLSPPSVRARCSNLRRDLLLCTTCHSPLGLPLPASLGRHGSHLPTPGHRVLRRFDWRLRRDVIFFAGSIRDRIRPSSSSPIRFKIESFSWPQSTHPCQVS